MNGGREDEAERCRLEQRWREEKEKRCQREEEKGGRA